MADDVSLRIDQWADPSYGRVHPHHDLYRSSSRPGVTGLVTPGERVLTTAPRAWTRTRGHRSSDAPTRQHIPARPRPSAPRSNGLRQARGRVLTWLQLRRTCASS